ncbi:hypothetical protein MJ1_0276 [Nanobdella aerobiophila]|uniref:UPF0215 protein MJ1_0276 n=1 Tax=Nanobdella aerobiophila TaxID=2586965 RepID=A0A915WS23_9ARCH|nr:DUF99 family protein [Nanobdella aerobiophila]BBL45446.1 hypothetical protein MJ1_0276 [Nanobdella aerobiophila]
MDIKREIRIIGIDDGYFNKKIDKETIIIGVIFRGYKQIDGVLSNKIEIDGFDVNEKIIDMIKRTTHYNQLRIIMTNGVSFGGFNLIDFKYLYNNLNLPIISVVRKRPNIEKFKLAAKKIHNYQKRIDIINNYPEINFYDTMYGRLFFQYYGTDLDTAINIIKLTSKYSRIPEPVRIAHIVAMGVTRGYSRGKP